MIKFITNISNLFNCEDLIKRLELNKGFESGLLDYNLTEEEIINEIPKDKRLPSDNTKYLTDLLNSGYSWELIKWQHFNLDESFSDIINSFSNLVKMKNIRCFVTRLDPGNLAPYHWDECDCIYRSETNLDKIFRYTFFLSPANFGNIFIVDNKCFNKEEQGNVYKWNHYTDFHGAYNTSTTPQYLFHFLGTTDGY